jgi:hypothetical protein
MIGGVLRAVLAAVAGYIVGAGIIDAGMADQLIGGVMAIFTVGWSIFAKKAAAKATAEAVKSVSQ